jgi:glycosyltransferase involved in cell wall biosynthesis
MDFPHQSPSSKAPLILASGRIWDGGKNLTSLAEIAGGLAWPVHIAGAGMPAEPARDANNVHWLGEISHDDLQERMHRAAIYAAPALYEPFGLGILEAARAGCALVLSDIPSLRELWEGAAKFVPAGDTEILRDVLARLCDDADSTRSLQRAAATHARRYSLDRSAAAYMDLYDHLLNPSRRPRATAHPELHA